eukprot:Skav211464  [mRNA]  locus=scaffold379:278451:282856:- [translate_table: standard]
MDFTREAFNLQSPLAKDFDNAKAQCQVAVTLLEEKKRKVQGTVAWHGMGKLSKILYDMSMKMMVRDNFVHGDLHGGNILYSMSDDHVTVLDCGIATSLDKRTFAPFGPTVVVPLPLFLVQSFEVVNTKQLKTDIQRTMDKRHGMLLKGDVASTLFTISISEGLVRQLDPSFDVAAQALPYITKYMGHLGLSLNMAGT